MSNLHFISHPHITPDLTCFLFMTLVHVCLSLHLSVVRKQRKKVLFFLSFLYLLVYLSVFACPVYLFGCTFILFFLSVFFIVCCLFVGIYHSTHSFIVGKG